MGKLPLFQIAGKLQYTPTDNGFKQVQNAYLAVISNLDKLVQYCYIYLCKSGKAYGLLSNACHFDLRQIILISALINREVYKYMISVCKVLRHASRNTYNIYLPLNFLNISSE